MHDAECPHQDKWPLAWDVFDWGLHCDISPGVLKER